MSSIGKPVLESALHHVVVVQPRVGAHHSGLALAEDLTGAEDDRGACLLSLLLHLQHRVHPPEMLHNCLVFAAEKWRERDEHLQPGAISSLKPKQ